MVPLDSTQFVMKLLGTSVGVQLLASVRTAFHPFEFHLHWERPQAPTILIHTFVVVHSLFCPFPSAILFELILTFRTLHLDNQTAPFEYEEALHVTLPDR